MRIPIDPGGPDFDPAPVKDLIDRIVEYYRDRDTVLVAIGTSGHLMAEEIRRCGLQSADVFRIEMPRVSSPDGRQIELEVREIREFLAQNEGRHVLVLDWRILTGQRLQVLLDLLRRGDLASLRTAVGYDIKNYRRYGVPVDDSAIPTFSYEIMN